MLARTTRALFQAYPSSLMLWYTIGHGVPERATFLNFHLPRLVTDFLLEPKLCSSVHSEATSLS